MPEAHAPPPSSAAPDTSEPAAAATPPSAPPSASLPSPNVAPRREPRVGVGVLCVRAGDSRVLVGCRRGSHGAGTWALPGGHLEFGESWAACSAREVEEETGLRGEVRSEPAGVFNVVAENTHYVTIIMRMDVAAAHAVPENREPHKCDGWEWVALEDVPLPRFPSLQALIDSGYKI